MIVNYCLYKQFYLQFYNTNILSQMAFKMYKLVKNILLIDYDRFKIFQI